MRVKIAHSVYYASWFIVLLDASTVKQSLMHVICIIVRRDRFLHSALIENTDRFYATIAESIIRIQQFLP
jgi:hypothetical protein